jgi:hypothetical protein
MKDFPAIKPTESGYYMTRYKNPDGNIYYKAISWNNAKQEWVRWNKSYVPEVLLYWEETRSDYYTECLGKEFLYDGPDRFRHSEIAKEATG